MKDAQKAAVSLAFAVVVMLLPGCGSNIDEVLFQAASATGRQAFDLFLTDFANALAAGLDGGGTDAGGTGDNVDGGTDTGDGGGSGGGAGAGDGGGALDGGALFADNCAACHGEDGASGFAPDITGATADTVIAAMMLTTHESISLSDEELAAIAVWLGGDGGAPTGDATAGETTFTANNCSACHCADASGGCALSAPALTGVAGDTLDALLRGDDPHPGGKFDFSDQDIADLEAYLATL